MALEVRKYPLEYEPWQVLELPAGAKVLAAGPQHGLVNLWVLVDPAAAPELRSFVVAGTGWSLAEEDGCELEHVGTVLVADAALVWHVFEATSREES